MPTTVLLLIAALGVAESGRGQQYPTPSWGPPESGQHQRPAEGNYLANTPPNTPPNTAPNTAPTSPERLGRRLPVELVKRSDEPARGAAKARYGEAIKMPSLTKGTTGKKQSAGTASGTGTVTSVVFSSLAIVLGLFFLLVWLARCALPKSATALPSDVLEVLGRSPLASRHHLQLIRLGRRLLLVSVTAEGAETLAEITDPDEVNHLSGLCRQSQPNSISGSFRQILHQLGSQPQPRSRRRSARGQTTSRRLPASSPCRHAICENCHDVQPTSNP